MFPTVPVPRNGIKNLWKDDALLKKTELQHGREVMDLVERHGTVPSLPDLKRMLRTLVVDGKPKTVCVECDGTYWIEVECLNDLTNKVVRGVVRCKCGG
jgi:hypothetical protein